MKHNCEDVICWCVACEKIRSNYYVSKYKQDRVQYFIMWLGVILLASAFIGAGVIEQSYL